MKNEDRTRVAMLKRRLAETMTRGASTVPLTIEEATDLYTRLEVLSSTVGQLEASRDDDYR